MNLRAHFGVALVSLSGCAGLVPASDAGVVVLDGGGPFLDAGHPDAGAMDAGADAGGVDAGGADAAVGDGGAADSGLSDAGPGDAGLVGFGCDACSLAGGSPPTLDDVLLRCPAADFGGVHGYRCEEGAGFSSPTPRWSCGDPSRSRCLVQNGLVASRSAFDGGVALELPRPLPDMVQQWWAAYVPRVAAGLPVDELEVLLANAYDQLCRDARWRDQQSCQFPFPARQVRRRLATGEACPPATGPGSARFLFANGSDESHVLLPELFLPLSQPLGQQLAAWLQQGLQQPNIAALVQLARDQLARCDDGGVDYGADPQLSQFAGSLWVARVDDGADRELFDATDFPVSRWANPDGGPVEIPATPGNAYVVDAGWLVGTGPGAFVVATLDGGTITARWLTAPTQGETPGSPRATLLEFNALGFGSHAWSWSDEEVRFAIDVRGTEARVIEPILWATYSADDAGAEPNYVVFSGSPAVMDGGWQHLVNVFRLPGPSPRNRGVPSVRLGAGLDMLDIVGLEGVLEVRRPSLRRVLVP